MSALVLDYSNEVRIDAPLRMVWSHLSDLNYILQFLPERDDFEVAEDGSHGSCHAVLVIGPLHIPMTIDVELGDLTVDEKVTFACSIDALATTLDMVITLRRASAQRITAVKLLSPDVPRSLVAEQNARLIREARALAAVRHPGPPPAERDPRARRQRGEPLPGLPRRYTAASSRDGSTVPA